MKNIIEHEISQITKSILDDYGTGRNIDKMDLFNQPSKEEIIAIVEDLLKIVYPGYYRDRSYKIYNIKSNSTVTIEDVAYHLNKQILLALKYTAKEENDVEKLTEQAEKDTVTFLKKIPDVRAMLETDLEAAFQGDPAAKYRDEIILSYPGMFAITVNRLAHELFLLEVPLIPRIMTEYAHRPWYWCGSWRDHGHRRSCKNLSGCDSRCTVHKRRTEAAGCSASSDH